jgi:V8-like Glu-specific endopeptidase
MTAIASTKSFAILPILLVLASSALAEVEDLNTELMRATVKISHDKSTATGFVLSNGKDKNLILVTAAHVFENTPGAETTVVFRSKQADGEYKKEPTKLVIRQDGKPLWTRHPTEDVAVIWVVPPKNADLALISTDLLATDEQLRKYKIHPGDTLAYLGFPHREEGNKAGFPLLRAGPIASFPLVPTMKTKTFFLSANTFEGDSGAPVYMSRPSRTDPDREEVRLIVGLVAAQRFLEEEMKMIYGTTKVRHRLGLAIVIHASFISEAIQKLK